MNEQLCKQLVHEDRCYFKIFITLKIHNDSIANEFLNVSFMPKGNEFIFRLTHHKKKNVILSGGAFGVFEATDDISDVCKAAVFKKGTKTRVLARFSTVGM